MEFDEDFEEYLDRYLSDVLPKKEGETEDYSNWRMNPTIVEKYKKIIEHYGGQYREDSEEGEIERLKDLIKSMIEDLEKCENPDGTNLLSILIASQNAANASLNEVLPEDEELAIPDVSKDSILKHLKKCNSVLELAVIARFYANKLAHYYQEVSEKPDKFVKLDSKKNLIGGEKEKLDSFKKSMMNELLSDLAGLDNGGSFREVKNICEKIGANPLIENISNIDEYDLNIRAIEFMMRTIKNCKGLKNITPTVLRRMLNKPVLSLEETEEIREKLDKILNSKTLNDEEKKSKMMNIFLEAELDDMATKEARKRVSERLREESKEKPQLFYDFKDFLTTMCARLIKENCTRGQVALEKNEAENNQNSSEIQPQVGKQNDSRKSVMGIIYVHLLRKFQLFATHFTNNSMQNTDPVIKEEQEPEDDLNPYYKIEEPLSFKVHIPLPDLTEKQMVMFKILSKICSIIDQEVDDTTRNEQIEEYLNSLDNEEWKKIFEASGTIENLIDKWKQEKKEQEILSQICSIIDQEVDDTTRNEQIEEYLNSLDNEEWKKIFEASGTIEKLIDEWKQEKDQQKQAKEKNETEPEKIEEEKEETEKTKLWKKKIGRFSMLRMSFDIAAGEYLIISRDEFMRKYFKVANKTELKKETVQKVDGQGLNHELNRSEGATTQESGSELIDSAEGTIKHLTISKLSVFAEDTDMTEVSDVRKKFLEDFKKAPKSEKYGNNEESEK